MSSDNINANSLWESGLRVYSKSTAKTEIDRNEGTKEKD